jgi:site-specific recombinase XerC
MQIPGTRWLIGGSVPGTEIAVTVTSLPVADAAPFRTRNPYWTYLARLGSAESRRTMQGCLDRIAVPGPRGPAGIPRIDHPGERVPWHQIRYEHSVFIRGWLTEQPWSASHINKHLSALRGVLKEAWRLSLMTGEEYQRAADVEQVSASRLLAGRNINTDEVAAILAACMQGGDPIGIRDAALIAVLQSTGMRREELATVRVEWYDPGERALQVVGKGNKQRTAYIHRTAAPYLNAWLIRLKRRTGPMFPPVGRWGNITDRPMTPRAVGKRVDQLRVIARQPKSTTHDWRRTFIGDVLDAGGDLSQAQQLAGHSSPITTARYDRRDGRKRRDTVDMLTLPAPDRTGLRHD